MSRGSQNLVLGSCNPDGFSVLPGGKQFTWQSGILGESVVYGVGEKTRLDWSPIGLDFATSVLECLDQVCPNPVLGDSSPPGFSVQPGRTQWDPR